MFLFGVIIGLIVVFIFSAIIVASKSDNDK